VTESASFAPPRRPGRRAWLTVGLLWAIALLNYLDRLMLATMGDSIKVANWEQMAPWPDPVGVAGAFAGVSNGALVVAGGANFPGGMPWEGGRKAYHDAVYVLEKPDSAWRAAGRMPKPLAYGVSASGRGGVVCIGGENADGGASDVLLLRWDAAAGEVEIEALPSLPFPLSQACGAVVVSSESGRTRSRLYVAGGIRSPSAAEASDAFLALDLDDASSGWTSLPPCPGPARILAGAASASGRFWLAGGAGLKAGPDGRPARIWPYLSDAWSYDPSASAWRRAADMPTPLLGMPSPAASAVDGVFFFFGGDDGREAALPPERRGGFNRSVLRYDAASDRWNVAGELPGEARVTVPQVTWEGRHVVPGGEVRPGVRSASVSHPMTNAQFGLLTSLFLWVYALFSPFGGYLADRFGRSPIILASLAVWSAVTWLTGHASGLGQLLVFRGVMGVSEAFYIPAALALIADYHRGPTRSLATGIHMSGLYAGAALGGLGGVIAAAYGWRASFTVFGVIGLAYGVLLLFFLREAPPEIRAGGEAGTARKDAREKVRLGAALKDLFGRGSFLLLLGYNCLLAIAFWGINGWLPAFLQDRFHLGQGAAGLNATVWVQAASFAGILIGGLLADRLSRRYARGRSLVPAFGFIAAAPFLFLSATTSVLTAAILGLVVFGVARGFSDANLMPVLCQVADKRYRATGYGILNFIGTLTGGLMVYAGGWLKDRRIGLGSIFQVAAAGLLLAGVLMLLVKPRPEGGPQNHES
jgi:N-acetylneuraminic acid mutarotase